MERIRPRPCPARAATLVIAATLAGCPGSLDDPSRFRLSEGSDAGAAACPDVVTAFLSNTNADDPKACAQSACHGSEAPQAGLDLASPGLVERLLAVQSESRTCGGGLYIDPDAPERSLIYDKLFADPGCGLPMPFGSNDLLTDEERRCVLAWAESVASTGANDGGAGVTDGGVSEGDAAQPADAGMAAGDAAADAAPEPQGTFWFEAEAGSTAPFEVQDDPDASGGQFIVVPEAMVLDSMPDPTMAATYEFEVTEDGTFWVWGRVLAPSGESDSFWVRIDEGTWYKWNNVPQGGWAWDDAHNSDDPDNPDSTLSFELTAGSHSLQIAQREDGAQLDKLVVTSDSVLQPTGLGD